MSKKNQKVIDALNELGTASTYDIAEKIGCTPSYAGKILRPLVAEGVVNTTKEGNKVMYVSPHRNVQLKSTAKILEETGHNGGVQGAL